MDFLFRVFVLQAIHQVQFRADGPFCAGRSLLDGANDFARAAADVALVDYFHRAFRMHQDF